MNIPIINIGPQKRNYFEEIWMPNNTSNDSAAIHSLAGSIAGLTAAIIVCPLDIVKFRLQNQRHSTVKPLAVGIYSRAYQSSMNSGALRRTLMNIFREEGIRGCYRGLNVTALAYMCDRAIWFPLYHQFKSVLDHGMSFFILHLLKTFEEAGFQNGL